MPERFVIPRFSDPAALAAWVVSVDPPWDTFVRDDRAGRAEWHARAFVKRVVVPPEELVRTVVPWDVASLVRLLPAAPEGVPFGPEFYEFATDVAERCLMGAPWARWDIGAGHMLHTTVNAVLAAAHLGDRSREAFADGETRTGRALESMSARWSATANAAWPFAVAWDLAPFRRWYDHETQSNVPAPAGAANSPRRGSKWL